jgi:Fe-S oxidoreductase
MHRCKDRGFCCGAGGARMWMEEKIGKRINIERTEEALELDPDVISTACPFCITMLSDALTAKKQDGEAGEHVEVLDVSQILLRSMTPVGVSASGAESGPEVGTTADDVAGTGSAATEHGQT